MLINLPGLDDDPAGAEIAERASDAITDIRTATDELSAEIERRLAGDESDTGAA